MRDNLPGVVGEDGQISKGKINALVLIITNFLVFTAAVLELVNGFLSRFDDELEQINIKQAIGRKNRRNQHSSRVDAITHTMKTEKSDFEGCGIELPDLFDADNLTYFSAWDGEVRYVQNIKLGRFRKSDLEMAEQNMEQMETV